MDKKDWNIIKIGIYICLALTSIKGIIMVFESFNKGYIDDGISYIIGIILIGVVYKLFSFISKVLFEDED